MKIKKKIRFLFPDANLLLIVFLIGIGVLLRFYNLSWGQPFYFHPDERNIASSISQLSFPGQMNPHFFAYGTLPIYTVFFLGLLQNAGTVFSRTADLSSFRVGFEQAIIIGRILSALLSCGILLLIYMSGRLIGGKKTGLVSLCLTAFSVGYIQYAHFSTFEIWISFLTLLLFYLLLNYARSRKHIHWILIAVGLGLLTSVKISSLIFLPLSLLIILWIDFVRRKKSTRISFIGIEKIALKVLLIIGICTATVFLTSPFFWFDTPSLRSSITYETQVATGKLPVFYTQGFIHALPIIDPVLKTYPFLLNPFVEIIFIVLLPYLIFFMIRKKSVQIFILFLFLSASFFSQTVLFVKWTRYYIPTLGFIYILLGYAIVLLLSNKKRLYKNLGMVTLCLLLASSIFYTYSYAGSVLFRVDSREEAAEWARAHIQDGSKILSEIYDMGIVPFNSYEHNIQLFNFYELENDPSLSEILRQTLLDTKYIILPSKRIVSTRLYDKKDFPKGNAFYTNLEKEIGYKKVYETPCDLFCKILYMKSPWVTLEETTSVFDRPTVTIYKKI